MTKPEPAHALTLGTAGHIDHGKTSLVRELTGIDTDRLPQEQQRGISIELGYARLALPSGRALSVIDVPGHERFVRTMIAGASGIDLALIVIACDDGVMPQTREHVAILELLGVEHAVVALTKHDLVDQDGALLARADVDELLAASTFSSSPVVEVSVRDGHGLNELRALLDEVSSRVEARSKTAPMRLPIDRVFTLHGIGTVVTGTLWSGSVAEGDRVLIEPRGREVRVRSVHVHDTPVEVASAGRRVALNLVGVDRDQVARGDLIVEPGAYPASYRLDVDVTALPDGPGLRHGELVQVLAGTAVVDARVALLGAERLPPGEHGPAQLRLRSRAITARGDRVILRSTAPPRTLAGAVVLDPSPRRHGGSAEALARLRLLAEGDPSALVRAVLADARWPASVAELAPRGLINAADAADALQLLVQSGEVLLLAGADPRYLAEDRYREIAATVRGALERRAEAHPLEPGVPIAALFPAAVEGLAARLQADGVLERDGTTARLPGATASSGSLHANEAAALIAQLEAGGFAPPDLPTIAASTGLRSNEFRALCAALAREGAIVRFGEDLAFTGDNYELARQRVIELCERQGDVTLAQVRDELGASRRIVQALLEHLDGASVTRRVGDKRILRRR